MLNILLSFAQFEREVSGERIRDKVAASKKKGIWIGGAVPTGYVAINKKLKIKPEEGEMIRFMFESYLKHKSITAVCKLVKDKFSHMRLAETLDKSKDQIRRLLNKLKRTNDITTTRIGCATLVRLINYNKYQGFEDTTPDTTATCPPNESQLIADYPPMTEERKQGNNVNNEKKLVGREIFEQKRTGGGLVGLGDVLARQGLGAGAKFKYHFTQLPPDWTELERYVAEKNIHINLEGFYSYYESNGWCERSGKKLDGWHFALCYAHKTGEYL